MLFSVCLSARTSTGVGGGVSNPTEAGVGTSFSGQNVGYPLPSSGQEGVPLLRSGQGVRPPRPPVERSGDSSYAAGGMPLAFTQEDSLVCT